MHINFGDRDCRIVDLSHTLSSEMPMTVPFGHVTWLDMKKGDFTHANCLFMGEHHGTHVDAPGHLLEDGGGMWIESLPLEQFMGPCCVIHAEDKGPGGELTEDDILNWEGEHGTLAAGDMVLCHFGWDRMWQVPSPAQHFTVGRASYYRNWPGLIPETAKLLQSRKIRFVGTDAPSIDTYRLAGPPDPEPSHPILQLGASKIIIGEGLTNLGELPPRGAYFMALPVKIKNGTGAPVRAVAFVPQVL